MRTFWLSMVLAFPGCAGEVAGAPEAATDDVVSAGELPNDAVDWLEAGRVGALADGEEYDLLLPVQRADGTWSEEPVTLTWHAEQADLGVGEPAFGICAYGSAHFGTASGTASATACLPFAAANAAKSAAAYAMRADCLQDAFDYCPNDTLPVGNATGSATLTSNVPTPGACSPLSGWTATATASGPCCASGEEMPFYASARPMGPLCRRSLWLSLPPGRPSGRPPRPPACLCAQAVVLVCATRAAVFSPAVPEDRASGPPGSRRCARSASNTRRPAPGIRRPRGRVGGVVAIRYRLCENGPGGGGWACPGGVRQDWWHSALRGWSATATSPLRRSSRPAS